MYYPAKVTVSSAHFLLVEKKGRCHLFQKKPWF
jgi:hypothetical protein